MLTKKHAFREMRLELDRKLVFDNENNQLGRGLVFNGEAAGTA